MKLKLKQMCAAVKQTTIEPPKCELSKELQNHAIGIASRQQMQPPVYLIFFFGLNCKASNERNHQMYGDSS